MAKETDGAPGGYLEAVKAIVSITKDAFKGLPPTTRAIVTLASFVAILLLAIDIILGFAGKLPAWSITLLFIISLLFFAFVAILLVTSESRKKIHSTCRRVPIYPLREEALKFLEAALQEIRLQAYESIATRVPGLAIESVRANIFLLARTEKNDYKLVIHRRLCVNMNHSPEWNIQFAPGQGATGRAFKMNTAGLTRRMSDKAGQWERILEMTNELKTVVHKDLKWIVSMPLIPTAKFESLGVLNIDGIAPVDSDEVLLNVGGEVREALSAVADYLELQPSLCVDMEQL